MKKVICFLLSVLFLAAWMPGTYAADAATVSVGTVSGHAGETVTVPVQMTGNPGLVAMRLYVQYDAAKLRLVGAQDKGLFGTGNDYFGNDLAENPYTLLWEDALARADYTGDGLLAELQFRIIDDAQPGTVGITLMMDQGSTFNMGLQNVSITRQNGTVQITENTQYTVSFIVDGQPCQTAQYYAGEPITKPADPTKDGFIFKGWTSAVPATMPAKDMTFEAVFERVPDPVIKIHNYTANKTVDYRTTITFSADDIQNPVSGAQIHWLINGQDKGTSDTYTEKEAKKDFTVQAKYMKDGKVLAESEIETVKVNAGFFARLKAFFRALFGRLPKVVQEYLGIEIIDRVLP